jgi:hypothetical protein
MQIPALHVKRRPSELPDSPSKMVSKLVDHRVYDIVGPFATGHRVVQDCPKMIGSKLNLREALPWQIIFESTALLVRHASLRGGSRKYQCAPGSDGSGVIGASGHG